MIIAVIILVYFVLGSLVCLLVCVNPNDPGILGKLNRLFLGTLPAKVGNLVKRVFGERVFNWFGKVKHYIMETNHPLVQIFYIVIAPCGGFVFYNLKGVMVFMPNKYVGEYQIAFAEILGLFCFWIYYKACSVSPGQITKNNEEFYCKKYDEYYDQILYTPKKKCQTCKTFKPARSKHCRTCDVCWSKFDHHCIWIRQCVGEKNYKWFLSFLFFHAILCLYYSLIGSLSVYSYIETNNLFESQFWMGTQYVKATKFLVFTYLFMNHTAFLFLIIMCFVLGVTLLLFVLYHFYLVSENMTSNERVKSNDYVAELKKIIKKQNQLIKDYGGWQKTPDEIEYFTKTYKRDQLKAIFQRNERDLVHLTSGWKGKGFIKNMKIIFSQ